MLLWMRSERLERSRGRHAGICAEDWGIASACYTAMPYNCRMQLLTVVESPLFTKYWSDYWTEEEHGEFMAHIAGHPEAGDVVPRSGGCRKIRWGAGGKGKSGGVRVITPLASQTA